MNGELSELGCTWIRGMTGSRLNGDVPGLEG